MRWTWYIVTAILGLILGLEIGALVTPLFAQGVKSPCDMQLDIVEFSRKQSEMVAAQTISHLQQQVAELQAKLNPPKPAPKTGK